MKLRHRFCVVLIGRGTCSLGLQMIGVHGRRHHRLFTSPTSSVSSSMANMSNRTKDEKSPPMFSYPAVWDGQGRQMAMKHCILPMSSNSHKGSSGRIGVLGGSAKYTGAPYYAAMASLKLGADLASVFCAEEAAIPIKCYSPELMVTPIYKASEFDQIVKDQQQDDERTKLLVDQMVSEVTSMMDRLHALVIGPGLGRCPLVFKATAQIIREAKRRNLPLVLDADALFLLTLEEYQSIFCQSLEEGELNEAGNEKHKVILTPNAMEYNRLNGFLKTQFDPNNIQKNGVDLVIVQKGREDRIHHNSYNINSNDEKDNDAMVCQEDGGLKRSGGLGDILAGSIGTLVAWNRMLEKSSQRNDDQAQENALPLACWSACCIVKRTTKKAFQIHHRAMTAPDVLAELGQVVHEMTTCSPV